MIKFFVKQFLYGRIFLWFKSNLSSIFFVIVLISLTFYSHNEYLNYLQFKQKTEGDYIGLSFVIKNLLILLITLFYFYFYFLLKKTDKSLHKSEKKIKEYNEVNRVVSLDYFLSDEEINKKNK